MRSIVERTRSGTETYVVVVISPATHASPVVTMVSHATRALGSSVRMASRTASEMASATLSGWPSVRDSDVKRWRSYMGLKLPNDGDNGGDHYGDYSGDYCEIT